MFTFTFLAVLAASCNAASIQSQLSRTLSTSGSANVIVSMKGGNAAPLAAVEHGVFATRVSKINALVHSLETHASVSQAPVLELLSDFTSTSFWASNSIYIENASADLVNQIAALDSVAEIHEEHIVTLNPVEETKNFKGMADAIQWGVKKVKATEVWNTNNKGAGVIVATTDTGVRATHEILRHNWIGNDKNGWYDPYKKTTTPNDQNGHGTHTMGTICGANGYGVAPEAKWMSCKGCSTSQCTEAALLGCGQYTLCPHDTQGNNKNCAMAPHLSSNSWGGGAGQSWYQNTVDAWQSAGIIPVFAQGNSGPKCSTANSPGDYENVIGVGASTSGDSLASFSSVGPAKSGLMKPDVSAPGHQVASAWMNSDSGYKTISGTSMACPHTAGVIALMIASREASVLSYSGLRNALTGTCNTDLVTQNKDCGGNDDALYPNNMFGYGVIDAMAAVKAIGGGGPAPGPTPRPTPTSPPRPTRPPMACKTQWGRCVRNCQFFCGDACYCP